MRTTVKRVELPGGKRIIAVSDIHAHFHHLKKLLEKINFSSADILFIVGDIIEKGPESLKTLWYVMDLCKKYTVHVSMGNVDAWRLVMFDDTTAESNYRFVKYIDSMAKRWGGCLFTDMCSELNFSVQSASDVPNAKTLMATSFSEEFEFLRSLPTIIDTQNFTFVHGGIQSQDLDSIVGTDVFDVLKFDAFLDQDFCFDKYVVVGHWPVTLYNDKIASANPIINHNRKIISLDGGCGLKLDGQLNALIIPSIDSTEFDIVSYDGLPVGTAINSQRASADPINIRYSDNQIEVLGEGYEFSYCEHISTGRRLYILNTYIHRHDTITTCEDFTDYLLPISPGDTISVVQRTSKGYLIKKGGISGWYCGGLKMHRQ